MSAVELHRPLQRQSVVTDVRRGQVAGRVGNGWGGNDEQKTVRMGVNEYSKKTLEKIGG